MLSVVWMTQRKFLGQVQASLVRPQKNDAGNARVKALADTMAQWHFLRLRLEDRRKRVTMPKTVWTVLRRNFFLCGTKPTNLMYNTVK